MSRVIGFRLDSTNPREAEALTVLLNWQERGYSTRHILTEALIRLASEDEQPTLPVEELTVLMGQLEQLIEQMQSGTVTTRKSNKTSDGDQLSEAFLSSVSKSSRPGSARESGGQLK